MASSKVKTFPAGEAVVCPGGVGCDGAGLSAARLNAGTSIVNNKANEKSFSCANPFLKKTIVSPPKKFSR